MYVTPGISPRVCITSVIASPQMSSRTGSQVGTINSRNVDLDSSDSNTRLEIDARRPYDPLSMEKRIKNINGHHQVASLPLYALASSVPCEPSVAPPPKVSDRKINVARANTVPNPPRAPQARENQAVSAPIQSKQETRAKSDTTTASMSSTPSASSATPSSSSVPSVGGLSTEMWTHIVNTYGSLSTVTRVMQVSKDLQRTASSSDWIRTCIFRGNVVGNETRWLWRYCSKADEIEAFWKNYFNVETSYEAYNFLRSDAKHPAKAAEIDRDVPRTFPAHPKFQTDRSRLSIQGVLRAISAANPKVGYCQGMNFVVAVFLLHMDFDEAQTTWLALALMKHYSYDQLYSPGVPLLPLRTFQFSGLIKKNLLPLYAHLESNGFAVDIFSHQWMMTLFAYIIEPEFLRYIWNVIFFVGWKAIFQAGLGIMTQLQDDIMKAETLEDISSVVHAQKKRLCRVFNTNTSSVTEALAKVFMLQNPIKVMGLRALEKEYVLRKWDTFLTTYTLSLGFELLPKRSEKPNLFINADAFACHNSPPWRDTLDTESHIVKDISVEFEVYRRLQKELLEWDAVVKNDVEVFQRRIAAALRELLEFEKTHHVLQQDVCALENCKDEFRQFKQTLIDSLYTTSMESTPHKETMGGLNEKIIETERSYVALCDQLAAKEDVWTPLREELEELRLKKMMLVEQFSAFLEESHRKRHAMLEDSWDLASR